MEWLRTDRNGFPYWEERATFNMYPHYGMLDLMDAKERHEKDSNSCIQQLDITVMEGGKGACIQLIADTLHQVVVEP